MRLVFQVLFPAQANLNPMKHGLVGDSYVHGVRNGDAMGGTEVIWAGWYIYQRQMDGIFSGSWQRSRAHLTCLERTEVFHGPQPQPWTREANSELLKIWQLQLYVLVDHQFKIQCAHVWEKLSIHCSCRSCWDRMHNAYRTAWRVNTSADAFGFFTFGWVSEGRRTIRT